MTAILGVAIWFAVVAGMLWLAGRIVLTPISEQPPRDWCEP